jgi:hypothetical protein
MNPFLLENKPITLFIAFNCVTCYLCCVLLVQ